MKKRAIIYSVIFTLIFVYPVLGSENTNIKTGFIVSSNVSLHISPDINAHILSTVLGHQTVIIGDESPLWYKVTLKTGKTGWIFKSYVALEPNPDTLLSSSSLALVGYAKEYINTRYVYGGTTPKGFDCSGFTRYIYSRFGYSIPHRSQDQMSIGKRVSKRRLLPGDLVFFTTKGSTQVNHVGIYIGEGNFIHASSGSGVVRIDTLSQLYYKIRYHGACRIIRNYRSNSTLTLR